MPVYEYTRRTGQQYTYQIEYAQGEYFIKRDGVLKKSFPDAIASGVAKGEDTPDFMLKLAIGDIETLNGMSE
jgi:hypothetical protein